MTENQRLKIIRESLGLTQAVFSAKFELKQGSYADVERGKVNVSGNIKRILEKEFSINIDWLEKGEGDMFVNKEAAKTNSPAINYANKGVPYYDVDFIGGYDIMANDQSMTPTFYIDFLPFNDCDYWINVTGKSMGPLIAHGDIVALKRVPDWKRFLLEGEIYAIVTDNGFRTIKMIGAGKDDMHYSLIPYNKSEDYKPQQIPKEVIAHVFRVKGNIKKFF